MKIDLCQPHALPVKRARAQLDELLTSWNAAYGLTCRWLTDTQATVTRPGLDGALVIEPEQIQVHLILSFAIMPIKSTMEVRIKDDLKRLFGAQGTAAQDGV